MIQFAKAFKDAPYFYEIKESQIQISTAEVPDVHAGDVETATINAFYSDLVDREKAKSLPDVALGNNFEAWMFGGQLKQLSPQGYFGSPANYDSVNVNQNIEDCANRITEVIMIKINSTD